MRKRNLVIKSELRLIQKFDRGFMVSPPMECYITILYSISRLHVLEANGASARAIQCWVPSGLIRSWPLVMRE